jgi:malonate-semialdehyde dehydrogenase (acetylating)/methylmalonate-semialdehyde dehydrogenase
MSAITHWINGKPWEGTPARTGKIYEPATGVVQNEVALAGVAEVNEAVAAATEAFPAWRETPITRRQNVMFAFRELVVENRHEIAKHITSEHGKTIPDALGEVQRGLEVIEFACNITHMLKGEFSEQVSTGVDTFTIRQPLGVVAGVTPFNFPAMVPMWMYPLAIACGNTFVLKPSEKDPSASVFCAELAKDAGLPPGVLNVVHGDKVAVDRILEHPDIEAVSFVGSTPIARYIYEHGTKAGKRVQALGGAKNHMVVLPDADMGLAADAAVSAGFGSAGERCMAIAVVVSVGDAADRLLPEVTARMAKLRTGPGYDPDSEMGPLVTPEHRDKVVGFIDRGVAEGAELVVDGRGYAPEGFESGFYVAPTLFDRVSPNMEIYKHEIFGPVLSVVRVDHYQDAIEMINQNPYGNGTAVFTNDGGAARKFQNEIQVGMVGINVPIPVPLAFYSFGGWKSSIFGSSPIYGPEGVRFYTRQKVVITRWPDPIYRGVDLGFPQHGR